MKAVQRLNRYLAHLVPLLVIFLIVAAAGCGAKKPVTPGVPAVPDTVLHKLSVAAFEIANATDAGEKQFELLYSAGLPGLSDDDYARTVAVIFLSTQKCERQYIDQLKSLVAVDDSNRAQVVGWTKTFVGCANALIDQGVAGIKNPDARQKIQGFLAPIPAAVGSIANLLGIALQQTSLTRPCMDACAWLIFTEVKFGSKNRSSTHSARSPVHRELDRVFFSTEKSSWPFRSGPARCSGEDQRCRYRPDSGIPGTVERRAARNLNNPLRESWLFT